MLMTDLEQLEIAAQQHDEAREAVRQVGAAQAEQRLREFCAGRNAAYDPERYRAALEAAARREAFAREKDFPAGSYVYGSFFSRVTGLDAHPQAIIADHNASRSIGVEAAHSYVALPYALSREEEAQLELELVLSPEWKKTLPEQEGPKARGA